MKIYQLSRWCPYDGVLPPMFYICKCVAEKAGERYLKKHTKWIELDGHHKVGDDISPPEFSIEILRTED